MNLQHQRIQHACASLNLDTLASEWAAIADHAASNEGTLADFLEQLLHLELNARSQRTRETRETRETLLKFAGFPGPSSLTTTTSSSPAVPRASC